MKKYLIIFSLILACSFWLYHKGGKDKEQATIINNQQQIIEHNKDVFQTKKNQDKIIKSFPKEHPHNNSNNVSNIAFRSNWLQNIYAIQRANDGLLR